LHFFETQYATYIDGDVETFLDDRFRLRARNGLLTISNPVPSESSLYSLDDGII
jgi:hypothetical protein